MSKSQNSQTRKRVDEGSSHDVAPIVIMSNDLAQQLDWFASFNQFSQSVWARAKTQKFRIFRKVYPIPAELIRVEGGQYV